MYGYRANIHNDSYVQDRRPTTAVLLLRQAEAFSCSRIRNMGVGEMREGGLGVSRSWALLSPGLDRLLRSLVFSMLGVI